MPRTPRLESMNYSKWDNLNTDSDSSDDDSRRAPKKAVAAPAVAGAAEPGAAEPAADVSAADVHKARGDTLFHQAEETGDPTLYAQSASCYQDVLGALQKGAASQEGVVSLTFKCHLNLATAMIKLGKLDLALSRCSDAIALLPRIPAATARRDRAKAYKLRGFSKFKLGDRAGAVTDLNTAADGATDADAEEIRGILQKIGGGAAPPLAPPASGAASAAGGAGGGGGGAAGGLSAAAQQQLMAEFKAGAAKFRGGDAEGAVKQWEALAERLPANMDAGFFGTVHGNCAMACQQLSEAAGAAGKGAAGAMAAALRWQKRALGHFRSAASHARRSADPRRACFVLSSCAGCLLALGELESRMLGDDGGREGMQVQKPGHEMGRPARQRQALECYEESIGLAREAAKAAVKAGAAGGSGGGSPAGGSEGEAASLTAGMLRSTATLRLRVAESCGVAGQGGDLEAARSLLGAAGAELAEAARLYAAPPLGDLEGSAVCHETMAKGLLLLIRIGGGAQASWPPSPAMSAAAVAEGGDEEEGGGEEEEEGGPTADEKDKMKALCAALRVALKLRAQEASRAGGKRNAFAEARSRQLLADVIVGAQPEEARTQLRAAVDALRSLGGGGGGGDSGGGGMPPPARAALAQALYCLGQVEARLKDLEACYAVLGEAQTEYAAVGSVEGRANVAKALGAIKMRVGDKTGAREELGAALALCRQLGDASEEAAVSALMAKIELGDDDKKESVAEGGAEEGAKKAQ